MNDDAARLQEENHRLAAENQQLRTSLTDLHERQRETIRSLGVPILQVWQGVLCLPVIGAVDHERADQMTAQLLDRVAGSAAHFAVIDLTAADFAAETAQPLVRMIRCLRLIGVQAVLCGISPKTATILVDTQLDFGDVPIHRNLGDALKACLQDRRVAGGS